jgi:hypothetical protein
MQEETLGCEYFFFSFPLFPYFTAVFAISVFLSPLPILEAEICFGFLTSPFTLDVGEKLTESSRVAEANLATSVPRTGCHVCMDLGSGRRKSRKRRGDHGVIEFFV